MFSEKRRYLGFPGITFSQGLNRVLKTSLVSLHFDAIQLEKYQRRNRAGPLVPVNERMILNYVEKVRRGHLKEVVVEVETLKPGRGHANGRLQETHIADSRRPAIAFDLIKVDVQYFIKPQKYGFHSSVGQAFKHAAILLI